uniref:Uncharacterized protein n=1 Tax=Arundo donax TaxID=35708 RepID=A0A0A9E6S0_ARUDO
MEILLIVLSLCGIDLQSYYSEAQGMVQLLTCGQWAVFLLSFSMGSQYYLERMSQSS